MSVHRISRHRLLSTSSNPYLRYRQALRVSAAAQAIYAANHPDPAAPRTPSQLHERALIQMLDQDRLLEGTNVNILI